MDREQLQSHVCFIVDQLERGESPDQAIAEIEQRWEVKALREWLNSSVLFGDQTATYVADRIWFRHLFHNAKGTDALSFLMDRLCSNCPSEAEVDEIMAAMEHICGSDELFQLIFIRLNQGSRKERIIFEIEGRLYAGSTGREKMSVILPVPPRPGSGPAAGEGGSPASPTRPGADRPPGAG
jgi:hypothetical protein